MKVTQLFSIKFIRVILKLLYTVWYFLFRHRRTVTKLSSYGLSAIKVYQVRKWLRIVRGEKLLRFYYLAQFAGTPCFIKVARGDNTIKNEIYINKYLASCNATFIPKLLISDENYDDDTSMIATYAILGMREFTLPEDETTFEMICEEFESIHKFFFKHGIIHSDICETNLLLSPENHIYLIDFGLGKAPGSDSAQLSFAVQHGLYFHSTENTRTYDDAYSFLMMLNSCGISEEFKQKACYRKIEQLVGVHTHTININPDHKNGDVKLEH